MSNPFAVSQNYNRLCFLMESNFEIPIGEGLCKGGRWIGSAHYIYSNGIHRYYIGDRMESGYKNQEDARATFITLCYKEKLIFIDPETQKQVHRTYIYRETLKFLLPLLWKAHQNRKRLIIPLEYPYEIAEDCAKRPEAETESIPLVAIQADFIATDEQIKNYLEGLKEGRGEG